MITATFVVYGTHLDELKEEAYNQGVRFFRCHDDELVITEFRARQVVDEGRWKADVIMALREESEDSG